MRKKVPLWCLDRYSIFNLTRTNKQPTLFHWGASREFNAFTYIFQNYEEHKVVDFRAFLCVKTQNLCKWACSLENLWSVCINYGFYWKILTIFGATRSCIMVLNILKISLNICVQCQWIILTNTYTEMHHSYFKHICYSLIYRWSGKCAYNQLHRDIIASLKENEWVEW